MSLYRGAGGASDATDDSTVNAVAGYASAAASSASAAATSATEASNSATASASSASSAATSASSVATNATNASNSAALAANSAALALNYRNSAFTNRNLAQTAAGNASVSEANAATSAASAATSATNAENSRIESSNILTDNMAVRDATLAIYGNTTAMNNAVTAAATSATTATTQATNAASSAALASAYSYAANAAVSGASSYADSAQNSANDAQAYATSALSARDATLAAYDSFDDRYLGVKSADPTVDNDGNPLIAGSLYFNNQTNMMMLRAGNAWVAAYTSGGSPSFGNTVVNGTLGVTGAVTLSGGTANGVAYLNGSKVLTSGSALTFDGTNLGIGTSSPTAKLHVGWGNDQFQVTNPATGSKRLGASYTGYVSGNIYSAIDLNSAGTSGGDISFSVTASGGSLTTAMRLSEAGNLGLGVTPSAWGVYKAVDFNTRGLGLAGGDQSYAITCNAYYDGTTWRYKGTSSYRATRLDSFDGAYVFYTAPSGTAGTAITFTQAMTLDASGNLGIGTSSPTRPLHINATGTNGTQLLIQSGSAGGIQLKSNAGKEYEIQSNASSALIFYDRTAAAERLRLDSSGNLGIGTSSPSSRLTVKTGTDNVAIRLLENASNQAAIQFTDDPTTVAKATLAWNGSNAKFQIIAGTSSAITLETNGSERARIDSSGNLLIGGISTPGAKVMYIANATTVPASNPTGGGVLYVEGGALKYRGSSGTVTTIAAA